MEGRACLEGEALHVLGLDPGGEQLHGAHLVPVGVPLVIVVGRLLDPPTGA